MVSDNPLYNSMGTPWTIIVKGYECAINKIGNKLKKLKLTQVAFKHA
jgi:hypothetical protein